VKPKSAVSLASIQKEELSRSDTVLAAKLQVQEEKSAFGGEAACASDSHCVDDAALAARLQAEENGAAGASAPAAHTIDEDAALAAALQAEFDAEQRENSVYAAERRANLFTDSKVSVSLDLHRTAYQGASGVHEDHQEDDGEFDMPETTYDKTTRTRRDRDGNVVTKHNPTVNGLRNREKMDHFPLNFASGDMRKGSDYTISNKVYNSLKRFSEKNDKQRQRLHEKKEHSTHALALDANTRLILYKLVNSGVLDEVNGCLSTGKESVVFHGRFREDPQNPESPQQECAIKVFKTTLTEFKNRQQFLHGDRRYEDRVGKQGARKLVKLWAEKEMANLERMRVAGVPCPRVVYQRKHVLVMTFLGNEGTAAPKLKHAELTPEEWTKSYQDTVASMCVLHQQCRLVHCDLSEYNILRWNEQPYLIDVGQSVDIIHPRAMDFLFRDCHHVTRFFTSMGVANMMSAGELFEHVTGTPIEKEKEVEFLQKVSMAKGKLRGEEEQDLSRICEQMPRLTRDNQDILLEGIEDPEADEDAFEVEQMDEDEGDDLDDDWTIVQ